MVSYVKHLLAKNRHAQWYHQTTRFKKSFYLTDSQTRRPQNRTKKRPEAPKRAKFEQKDW
jgi:hypothetical protein